MVLGKYLGIRGVADIKYRYFWSDLDSRNCEPHCISAQVIDELRLREIKRVKLIIHG